MGQENIQALINEGKRIDDDAKYTAEAHHIISAWESKKAIGFKIVPALTAALSGFAILKGAPDWTAWLALIAGLVSGIYTVFDPARKSREHLAAAKNFTVIKHEARAFHESFSPFMDDQQCFHEVKSLRSKYNTLISVSPPTADWAFEKARTKIQAGRHEPDLKNVLK